MDTIDLEQSFSDAVDSTVQALPEILAFVLVLIIGHFISRLIQRFIEKLLTRINFNDIVADTPGGNSVTRASVDPSQFVGRFVYWVLMLFVLAVAIEGLGVTALTDIVQDVYSYIPHLIAAIVIFIVASALSVWARQFIARVMGDTNTGRIAGTAAPLIIMTIAVFMILSQLQIAPFIVNTTYIALTGSMALGMALAFGLGAKEVVSKMMNDAYKTGQKKYPEVKKDIDTARQRVDAENRSRSRRR